MTIQVAKATLLSALQPKPGPVVDKATLQSVLVPRPGPVADKVLLYTVLVPLDYVEPDPGTDPEPQPAARRRMFVNS